VVTKTGLSRLYHIPVLSRALDVLEYLQTQKASASLEELYRETRFSKTTIYRILRTLEHRGYLAHQDDGRYRLVSRPSKLRFGFAGQSEKLPFSQAVSASLQEAAITAGVDLVILDNQYDADTALRNAERLIRERVDLVIEFQIDQAVAPIIGDKIAAAGIPLIAVEIPHPHAIFFGVDNYRAGFAAGEFLGQHAKKRWKGKVQWIIGLDIREAGSLVQGRITGAFEGIRGMLPDIPIDRFVRLDARGLSEKSYSLTLEFLRHHPKDRGILIAAADDTSALGALRAVKQARREAHVAIAGQDCISEALTEMQISGTPFVASVSREVHTYGPRLMQLALAMVRGQHVAPYHHVNHKVVTSENLQLITKPADV
jgi:ribose transport system substrate-binding protein